MPQTQFNLLFGSRQPARDSQRSKVYSAEASFLYRSTLVGVVNKRFKGIGEIESYVWAILRRAYVKIVTIYSGQGRRVACCEFRLGEYRLKLPVWARTEATILHELAHALTDFKYGRNVAGHGWEFANTYLLLVRNVMGAEAHALLKAEYKAKKVRTKAKATRPPMSDERKAALRAQLAVARAAKVKS